nr:MAG: hypothetical protein [Caudoviricetes sp.]
MYTRNLITKEEIETLFRYENGKLFWKERTSNKIKKDLEAGTLTSNGYRTVHVNGKRIRTHRIIYILHFGYAPYMIDHINGDKLDNRIENLRPTNHLTNQFNAKISIKNTSGVKGVVWCKDRNKWKVQIQKNKKTHFFGYFDTLEEAEICMRESRKLLHEEFSREK